MMVSIGERSALIQIAGRANFTSSVDFKSLLDQLLQRGYTCFILDLTECVLMDSTFLGVLAGAALELRRKAPPGTLTLARVGERNLELIRNLGLHRLATVDAGNFPLNFSGTAHPLDTKARSEIESARLVLEAHESLISVDAANAAKFQDVLAFLRNRVELR
jgi:anti-anti-sigma factor